MTNRTSDQDDLSHSKSNQDKTALYEMIRNARHLTGKIIPSDDNSSFEIMLLNPKLHHSIKEENGELIKNDAKSKRMNKKTIRAHCKLKKSKTKLKCPLKDQDTVLKCSLDDTEDPKEDKNVYIERSKKYKLPEKPVNDLNDMKLNGSLEGIIVMNFNFTEPGKDESEINKHISETQLLKSKDKVQAIILHDIGPDSFLNDSEDVEEEVEEVPRCTRRKKHNKKQRKIAEVNDDDGGFC